MIKTILAAIIKPILEFLWSKRNEIHDAVEIEDEHKDVDLEQFEDVVIDSNSGTGSR